MNRLGGAGSIYSRLSRGGAGAHGFGDGILGERSIFVSKEQWCPGLTEMSLHAVGQLAEEDVSEDAILEAVVDRSNLKIVALHFEKSAFDFC